MSDEGEKTCPLCAEEMDLTDQQLKPCKCGYEICVWCWHHIMDMAEKDESEGRCPACRSPYDKEKIVGMAAKCESRLVADIHMEKKVKSQKAKAKSTEGRKQLSSVRVIQRNLVYIVGLPLNLADEELLQRKDYFGLYGKVLKVSMSRTASGVIQQYQNNTCSVYITYGKEDEAIRCIQNVHGFVLDGRPLRACFGTTKYCHAWLRNVPCTNQDCLYLHEVGSQEDSFTKDEIISAYTRSRVQQITGTTTNNVQRRSGLSLPPPTDDYCSHNSASSAKPILKNGTTQSTGNISKGSPPNGTRSIGLPAAASWGTRGSNCQPPPASLICTNGSSKQKNDTVGNASAFSSAATGFTQSSMHGDGSKRQSSFDEGDNIGAKVKPETPKPQHSAWDCPNSGPGKAIRHDGSISVDPSSQLSGPSVTRDNHRGIFIPPSMSDSNDQDGQSSSSSGHGNELMFTSEDGIQNMCSEMSSMFTESNTVDERSDTTAQSSGYSDNICKLPQNQGLSQYYTEKSRESATIPEHMASSINEACVFRDHSEWTPVSQIPSTSAELEEDIMSFESQRHKDPEVVTRPNYFPHSTNSLQSANHIFSPLQQRQEAHGANADRLFVDSKLRDSSFGRASIMSNGYSTNLASGYIGSDRTSEHSFFHSNEDSGRHLGRVLGEVGESGKGSAVDKGESSIISNILSLDFDTWDESLRSPQNLAKFFGDDEKQPGSQRTPSSRKPQPNNQSRFSFARQEECLNQGRDVQPSNSMFGQLSNNRPLGHDFVDNRDQYFDKRGFSNGISSSSFDEPEAYTSNHTSFLPNKPSAVSRAPISAPPGFSVPSRAPPPGFASHERHDHTFDSLSGSRLLDNSSLLRNTYQAQVNGNAGSSTDIEFMDPAILAVGKGRLQGGGMNNPSLNFSSQFSQFENDARLQLLMSRTLSQQQQQQQLQQQQNIRFPDAGESYSHHSGSFGLTSRLVDQSQVNSISPFAQMPLQQPRNGVMSNGHWDGWSEGQGTSNNVGMAELLRNERVGGYNKFYGGGVYEDSKFRMPSSDLYNRTFGM